MTRDDAGLEGPEPWRAAEAIEKQDLIFKGSFPGMLGVRVLEASAGHARGRLEVGPSVLHPGGFAHGGAIAGFADTIAAWATFPACGADETFTTIEFKVNFITGVRDGVLVAEAHAVHRGKRTMVLQVTVGREGDDTPVALMTVTQAIIRTRGAEAPSAG